MRSSLSVGAASLYALGAGIAFALAQPPWALWPVVFVCPALLLRALAGRGLAGRAAIGALAGAFAALAAAVGPAAAGASEFTGIPRWQGFVATALVGQLFGGVGFAAFAALAGDPLRRGVGATALRAGLALAAAEWIRANVFGGLPWLLFAHALAPSPALLALAPIGGPPLLSAWIGAIAAGGLRLAVGPERLRAAGVVAGCCFAAWLASLAPDRASGGITVPPAAAATAAVRVGLVQPSLPMRVWADPLHTSASVDHLVALSESAVAATPLDLLVWPENAVQAWLPANDAQVAKALAALAGGSTHLLLGAPRYDESASGPRFNAALLYAGSTTPIGVHDKTRLLPFFETRPAWLGAGAPRGSQLTPGRNASPLRLDDATLLGPLLCYEGLFAGVAARHVRAGAGILVHLSNDAWFGGSGGAEQHFASAIVQAATFARPLLRSTPTGVTAAVDARGGVVARLAADRPGVLVVDVAPARGLTWAARLGDAPAVLALGLCAVWTAIESRRARQATLGA
jgi:apolipoprotein N-acyltransferase